jgi:flagellin-specific chaperone FliS
MKTKIKLMNSNGKNSIIIKKNSENLFTIYSYFNNCLLSVNCKNEKETEKFIKDNLNYNYKISN